MDELFDLRYLFWERNYSWSRIARFFIKFQKPEFWYMRLKTRCIWKSSNLHFISCWIFLEVDDREGKLRGSRLISFCIVKRSWCIPRMSWTSWRYTTVKMDNDISLSSKSYENLPKNDQIEVVSALKRVINFITKNKS